MISFNWLNEKRFYLYRMGMKTIETSSNIDVVQCMCVMHRLVKQNTPFIYMESPKSWKVHYLFPKFENYALMWLFLFSKDINLLLLLQNNMFSLCYIFLGGRMNTFALLPFILHDSLVLNIWSITIPCHQPDILATSVVL